jgi:hypothetical protein
VAGTGSAAEPEVLGRVVVAVSIDVKITLQIYGVKEFFQIFWIS